MKLNKNRAMMITELHINTFTFLYNITFTLLCKKLVMEEIHLHILQMGIYFKVGINICLTILLSRNSLFHLLRKRVVVSSFRILILNTQHSLRRTKVLVMRGRHFYRYRNVQKDIFIDCM